MSDWGIMWVCIAVIVAVITIKNGIVEWKHGFPPDCQDDSDDEEDDEPHPDGH